MAERSIIDQLDDAVSALLAKPAVEWPVEDPVVASLVGVAEELRGLPREGFRAQLRSAFAERDTMSTPKMKVDRIPQNFPAVSARLVFDDASAAIEFYKQAFGAEEIMRLTERSGKIGHAEIRIADSVIMLSDEYPEHGAVSPKTLGARCRPRSATPSLPAARRWSPTTCTTSARAGSGSGSSQG